MNFVHLIQRVAHTVNNDVVRPLDRLVNPKRPIAPLVPQQGPIPGFPSGNFNEAHGKIPSVVGPNYQRVGPGEGIATPLLPGNLQNKMAIDQRATPLSESVYAPANSQTKELVDSARNIYGFTPEFSRIIQAAQPNAAKLEGNANLKKGEQAAAEFTSGTANNRGNSRAITLGQGYGSSAPAITHEALHAAWYDKPGVPQQFDKVIKKNLTPDIKQYLDMRLKGYANYPGRKALDNYDSLSSDIKSEVHSYLSEFPLATEKALPKPLQKYYSRFVNVNNAINNYRDRYLAREAIQNAIDPQRILDRQKLLAADPDPGR